MSNITASKDRLKSALDNLEHMIDFKFKASAERVRELEFENQKLKEQIEKLLSVPKEKAASDKPALSASRKKSLTATAQLAIDEPGLNSSNAPQEELSDQINLSLSELKKIVG